MLPLSRVGPLDHSETPCPKLQGTIYLTNRVSEFFLLRKTTNGKGRELKFLYLVTKSLGKHVYSHSS